ncbi:hypothetical protein CFIMG_007513RA00001 [Ceratocystis fimbriata CBS 114723]|uniref:Uncharacterized protein n=1 Tax=Ceratocystis fimbriata CBS 114723 TaxID=1035309 RepID=A0A2C5WWC1_9PEZI|nr:hypothetical protein CFIMG_007513RA00001 [Ceratocystis fimbriata CBS 114723]
MPYPQPKYLQTDVNWSILRFVLYMWVGGLDHHLFATHEHASMTYRTTYVSAQRSAYRMAIAELAASLAHTNVGISGRNPSQGFQALLGWVLADKERVFRTQSTGNGYACFSIRVWIL